MAKEAGRNHALALRLWRTGIHEARILAAFVDEPGKVATAQMEKWVRGFDSWDVCDQVCSGLFDRTPYAWSKALEWSRRKQEFVKRAGFVLMAALAVHAKDVPDTCFAGFFPAIRRGAEDERNFVKKAVNWAIRQIGKRSRFLNRRMVRLSREIARLESRSARWIAADALRELESAEVRRRLK